MVLLTKKRWSSSDKDPAFVTRGRGSDSHPVFLVIDNLAHATSAYDVTVTYLLAMQELRVQAPLGALDFRVWESLVFRVLREHEIAGSNPAILTLFDAVGPVLVRAGGC